MSLTFSILRQFLIILHAGKANKNAFKVLMVTEYTDVKIEVFENFEMCVSNKTPEFIKMNPLGKVHVLETPDRAIFESNAIARYDKFARLKSYESPLFGSSLIEYIDTNLSNWYRPRVGLLPYFPVVSYKLCDYLISKLSYMIISSSFFVKVEEAVIASFKRSLNALNTHLVSNTYCLMHKTSNFSFLFYNIVVSCMKTMSD
ncbi:hypothetical protein UlMin_015377 [Ulmus minor]